MDDVAQLCSLKYEYCYAFDSGDLARLTALFTADAVCDLGPFGTWRGIAEITDGYREQMVASKVPGGRLHSVSNPLIEVDGDDARGRWYLVDYDIEAGASQPIRLLAGYDDEYRRERGAWRISLSRLTIHRAFRENVTGR
jgi:hypothetical protein